MQTDAKKEYKVVLNNIHDLRREIRKIGYSVKTQRLSHGQHATYGHIQSVSELTGNVFTEETIAKWQALFEWLRKHSSEIAALQKKTEIYGLNPASDKKVKMHTHP